MNLRVLVTRGARVLLAAMVLALTSGAPARADDTTDLQAWALLTLQANLSKRWIGYMEAQPRFGEDISSLERVIYRPAFGYRLTDKVSLWQGYAYIPQYNPSSGREHRLFQQLQVDGRLGRAATIHRTRLEERMIHGINGPGVRLRHMFRIAQPISKDGRWMLIGSDELFMHLNTTEGQRAGFDQNRLYVGIGRQLTPRVRLEGGYIWTFINARNAPDRNLHIFFTQLAVNL